MVTRLRSGSSYPPSHPPTLPTYIPPLVGRWWCFFFECINFLDSHGISHFLIFTSKTSTPPSGGRGVNVFYRLFMIFLGLLGPLGVGWANIFR